MLVKEEITVALFIITEMVCKTNIALELTLTLASPLPALKVEELPLTVRVLINCLCVETSIIKVNEYVNWVLVGIFEMVKEMLLADDGVILKILVVIVE